MTERISGAFIRLHGPFTHRHVDRGLLATGVAFLVIAAWLASVAHWDACVVSLIGGAVLIWQARTGERWRMARSWEQAATTDDPITSLVLFEYLWLLPFRDLAVVAEWRVALEAAGLPMAPTPDDPPQVRAVWAHLAAIPREL